MDPEENTTPWSIHRSNLDGNAEALQRIGTQFQLANGYMGYRGTLDEFRSQQFVANTLAGLYDQVGEAWREPVNAPNCAFSRVTVDGVELNALNSEIVTDHEQSLHLRDAVFQRKTTFTVNGNAIEIRSRRFLSLEQSHLIAVEFQIQSEAPCRLELVTGIDLDIWDLNGPHLESFSKTCSADLKQLCVTAKTHEQAKTVVVSECFTTQNSDGCSISKLDAESIYGRSIQLELQQGETLTFHKFATVCKSGDFPESKLKDRGQQICIQAQKNGFDQCLRAHQQIWEKRWQAADISIEGDSEAELALRYSLFQLLMVAPVSGSGNSIPARALSGQVYKGAIFWDTEFFMFPFFLHTLPEVAEDLLRYRIHTLPGAKRKAQNEGTGFRGAFYAWESQESGDDACTYFNVGDPFTGRDLRTHFRDKQIHISGDIALAFWDHFQHTGDDTLLKEGGAEVTLECARFYASWIYFKPEKERYEILDVIGPDEYHERVNNNAFTNQIAHATFATALAVVKHFQSSDPPFLSKLLEQLDMEAELSHFQHIVERLYLPKPDTDSGIIEQFDSYFKLEDASLETVRSRKKHPTEYLGAGQGVAAHTQIIKQADVIMMLHRFRSRFPDEIKAKNWEYYEPRTEHGSSLSACAYSMVACDCGWVERAYPYFLKTAKVDLEANYKMYAGTTFIGGSHPAANGGSWMAVVFGFAGLDASTNPIQIRPQLPKHWKALRFNFCHQNGSFEICIKQTTVTITPNKADATPCQFKVNDKEFTIHNTPVVHPL